MDNNKVLRAFDLIKQGDAQSGMNLLKEEFLKTPYDWKIHYHTGMAWRIIGDLDKAIFSYKRAIQLCPDNESSGHINYYGLGIAFQLKGDFDNAIDNLRKAYQLDNTSVQALNSLGLTYKKKGDLEKAIEIYNHACQTMMNNIMQKLQAEGHEPTHQSPDDEKVAIVNMEIFNHVPGKLKEDNLYCMLQNNIGVCYAEMGKIEEAKSAFRESIQFIPDGFDYPAPYYGLQQLEE
jgi:tetratricopeptide (TPR) repeat protein